MDVKTPAGIIAIAMLGSVGAVWISLVGLFWLAITHDGEIASQVANSALALVGATITVFSTVAGVHVVVNRPSAAMTAGSSVQTLSPGVVMPISPPAPPAPDSAV